MEKLDQMLADLDRQEWLERASLSLQKAVQKIYESAGPGGIRVRDFLHGVWLGHPVHAFLTDIPIGAYTLVTALDLVEAARSDADTTSSNSIAAANDTILMIGIAGAGAAAVAGATDWQHTVDRPRRVGFLHAMLNTSALGLYLLSLFARKSGSRATGRSLAMGGFLLSMAAGYLGGHLAYGYKIGMNRAPVQGLPKKFTPIMDSAGNGIADLPDEQPQRAFIGKIPLLVVRRGGRVYALAETCAHMAGPLAKGKLTEPAPAAMQSIDGMGENLKPADFSAGCIICPWHGSQFSLVDGEIAQGPSVYPQPAFETRLHDGKIEVRVKPNPNLESG